MNVLEISFSHNPLKSQDIKHESLEINYSYFILHTILNLIKSCMVLLSPALDRSRLFPALHAVRALYQLVISRCPDYQIGCHSIAVIQETLFDFVVAQGVRGVAPALQPCPQVPLL